jgi:hypothetical protein
MIVATTTDYTELLANWSVESEQKRADFLDLLYSFYKVETGLYTGLYQRFLEDKENGLLEERAKADPETFEKMQTLLNC